MAMVIDSDDHIRVGGRSLGGSEEHHASVDNDCGPRETSRFIEHITYLFYIRSVVECNIYVSFLFCNGCPTNQSTVIFEFYKFHVFI